MRLRMLGPLEVWDGDSWVPVPAAKQRALLAILALHRDGGVDRHRLIDMLWNGRPPPSAARLLPHYVWRLRALLPDGGGCELRTVPNGYLLAVDPAEVDGARFGMLVDEARQAADEGDTERAVRALGGGLALWRGPALADTRSHPLLEAAARRLDELHVAARESLAELMLAQGRHAAALAELEELTAAEPYRERAWRLFMLALHRAGRRPDALAAYRRLWRIWTDELGIEPGRESSELHRLLLADDPSVAELPDRARMAASQPARGRPPGLDFRPAQLPPGLADFTGRTLEVAELIGTLRRRGSGEPPPAAPLTGVTVYGPGGMGKTALAVRAGHLLRPAFPDGQLFVDLHGAQGRPLDPGRVLAQFLHALGVTPSALPEGVDALARTFRSVLADRRVLVVLDNAADEAQVRPLLPPGSCAVALTSRRPLAGLEGLTGLRLDVLAPAEATELLGRIAGAARVRAEPAAAARIVAFCGGLPLAVRTAGARLAAKPHWPLDSFAARLADEHRRLDELRAGDLEVRASLAMSYRALAAGERAALGAAALSPPADFAAWLLAAGCAIAEADAEDLAERLVDAQLLDAVGVDVAGQSRYRLHDLTRMYVLERLAAEQGAAARREALARRLDACVALVAHAVEATGDRVRGFDPSATPPGSRHAATAQLIERDPFAWYAAERAVLVGAVDQAAEHGSAVHAWQLAHALALFFEVYAAWDDWKHTHELARACAAAGGQAAGKAAVLSGLGRLELDRGRFTPAMTLLREAERLSRSLSLKPLLAQILQRLGQGSQQLGPDQEAIAYLHEALAIAESLADRVVQCEALRGFGWSHQLAGRLDAAATAFERALALIAGTRSRHQQPWLLGDVARVHLAAGRTDAAAAAFEQAIAVAEGLGDRRAAVHAMYALGDLHRRAGDFDAARTLLERALRLARELFDEHAESLTLRRLGVTYTELGRYDDARACLARALQAARAGGRAQAAAVILLDLGTAHARAGEPRAAIPALRESIAVFRQFGLADFERRAEDELRLLT